MRNPFSVCLPDPDHHHAKSIIQHLQEVGGQENVEEGYLQRYLCSSFRLSWALELHERLLVV